MDYEHEPTRGPGAWIGAGLLVAVGGAALIVVSRVEPGSLLSAVIGWVLVGVGVMTAAVAVWWSARRRR